MNPFDPFPNAPQPRTLAERARLVAETRRLLAEHGLPATGDLERDRETLAAALRKDGAK